MLQPIPSPARESAHPVCLEWLGPGDEPAWDAFVQQHPLGLVYHLSAWRKVLEESFPHITGRFLAIREGQAGRILAGLPAYAVRSPLLGNRIVSVPWASICDPLISRPEELQSLLPALIEFQKAVGARFTELRVVRNKVMREVASLGVVSSSKHHFINVGGDLAPLLNTFHESAVRRMIKKAERNKLRVAVAQDQAGLESFHPLLTQTRQRLGLPTLPFRFFHSMWRALHPRHLKVYLALNQAQPVGGLLVLTFGKLCSAEYSGNLPAYRNSGVNQLLFWEAIKQAHSEGCDTFSLGRTDNNNAGLLEYKRRWGTQEEQILRFYHPRSFTPPAARLGFSLCRTLVQAVVRRTPARLNDFLGEFIYRHWG